MSPPRLSQTGKLLFNESIVKNRRLAKSIADAGWRAFVTWLGYMAQVYGKVTVAVPPRYTSQDCSGCGERVTKALSERTHVCPYCMAMLDRDHNAARNILALGLRQLGEPTAGHAGSHAWGQSALYPLDLCPADTAAG